MPLIQRTGMDGTVLHDSVQYKNNVYIFNGRNRMVACNGLGFRYAGIQGVPFTPGVASAGVGNLTGRFVYIVVPVNSKQVNASGLVVAGLQQYVSASIMLNSENCIVSGIPATHPDSQVDYWYIYRTLAGQQNAAVDDEGQNYYYTGAVAIGTTTFTDSFSDTIIKGQETVRFNQQLPPTFKYGKIYGDRLFGMGFDPITGGTGTLISKAVTFKQLTADVATITAAAHGFTVGQYVTVNIGDALFDGTRLITAVTTNTFSYNRNNNQLNVGSTAVVTGTAEQMSISGITLPDGVVGTWFQRTGDSRLYRVTGYNSSTNITVVGRSTFGYVGTNGAFSIFSYPWQVFYSEQFDFEAFGPDGFDFLNTKDLPGFDPGTALFPYEGNLYVFSASNIYAITGKGSDITDINITPEPIFKGLGAVGGYAVDAIEGQIYFMSLRGPAVMMAGSSPQLIGMTLLENYISKRTTPLTATDLSIATVQCQGRFVRFNLVANSGDTENSVTFRFDRELQLWHPEAHLHSSITYHDNGDGGLYGRAYYVQGASIFEHDVGTVDCVSTVITGTVTAFTTTSIADANAVFPNTGGGMVEAYVHIFDSTGNTLIAERRIKTQTGVTGFGWSGVGVGGGAVNGLAVGCTYKIGAIHWVWQTKTLQTSGTQQKLQGSFLTFHAIDSTASVIATQLYDTPKDGGELTAKSNPQIQPASELVKPFAFQTGNYNFAVVLESYTNAKIRDLFIANGSLSKKG